LCCPSGWICAVQVLSDYYLAALGYEDEGILDHAANMRVAASKLHAWLEDMAVDGIDADSYALSKIAVVGLKRNHLVYLHYDAKYHSGELVLNCGGLRGWRK